VRSWWPTMYPVGQNGRRVAPMSHARDTPYSYLRAPGINRSAESFRYRIARPLPMPMLSRISDMGTAPFHRPAIGAFADFVRIALAQARTGRGWNGSEVARRTGLSRQTLNRWRRGELSGDPEPARVVTFCETLGIDPSEAFGVLGWERTGPAGSDAAMDPDVAALLRRLFDPEVSETEKYYMRETIRYLANRQS